MHRLSSAEAACRLSALEASPAPRLSSASWVNDGWFLNLQKLPMSRQHAVAESLVLLLLIRSSQRRRIVYTLRLQLDSRHVSVLLASTS